MGGEWICLGVVDLLGIISFFLLSLVVRKLVVGYLKDTNAGECCGGLKSGNLADAPRYPDPRAVIPPWSQGPRSDHDGYVFCYSWFCYYSGPGSPEAS